jgi:hypothetical protein
MARRTDVVWRCRCGAKNDVASSRCARCGLENPVAPPPTEATAEEIRSARDVPGYFNSPRPLSDAESLAAATIYRLVATGEIGWDEARAQLEELFGDEVVRRAIVDQPRRAG